jgi:hypothetical protein
MSMRKRISRITQTGRRNPFAPDQCMKKVLTEAAVITLLIPKQLTEDGGSPFQRPGGRKSCQLLSLQELNRVF